MLYHALVLNNMAVVRSADEGITDLEFTIGVRQSGCGLYPSRLLLEHRISSAGMELLPIEDWREYVVSKSPDGEQDTHIPRTLKNTYSPYDRAPWETNMFKEYY